MAALGLLLAAVAIALVAGVAWWLARRRLVAMRADGTQEVTIRVEGKYEPAAFRVRQGVPLRVNFVRVEDEDCSGRVIFPDFGIERTLPAFRTTTVELTPDREGEFLFTCEMGMYHGAFTVVPNRQSRSRVPRLGPRAAEEPTERSQPDAAAEKPSINLEVRRDDT